MKDLLNDIITHTHALGCISVLKILPVDGETCIEGVSDDKSVILRAKTKTPVAEFDEVFGMPNLNNLDSLLKCPEYQSNSKLSMIRETRGDTTILTGIHIENEKGDFQNDYRFMTTDVINAKLKSVKFKGASWNVDFEPSMSSIRRLEFQSDALNSETICQVKTKGNDLVFQFGDANTHAGSFVFHAGVNGKLKGTHSWPIKRMKSILNLNGKISMYISDSSVMRIVVDSGLVEYEYLLPAFTK